MSFYREGGGGGNVLKTLVAMAVAFFCVFQLPPGRNSLELEVKPPKNPPNQNGIPKKPYWILEPFKYPEGIK